MGVDVFNQLCQFCAAFASGKVKSARIGAMAFQIGFKLCGNPGLPPRWPF